MQDQFTSEKPSQLKRHTEKKISFVRLVPSAITVLALCLGLTSIRLGITGRFETAVILLFIAALLDGIDGRLAHLLKAKSKIGAQLDSLVDFLNFGVAPVLLVYIWAMPNMGRLGWLVMMIFTVCAALRLARFNVEFSNPDRPVWQDGFFAGVPTPAAGLLVLVPLIIELGGLGEMQHQYTFICLNTIILSGLMVSNIPTFSNKAINLRVSRKLAVLILLLVGVLVGTFLTFPWISLLLFGTLYVLSIVVAIMYYSRLESRH